MLLSRHIEYCIRPPPRTHGLEGHRIIFVHCVLFQSVNLYVLASSNVDPQKECHCLILGLTKSLLFRLTYDYNSDILILRFLLVYQVG